METERDYVVFTDDDGNEIELDVIRYFEYNDNEYAILVDCTESCECKSDECDCETSLYIMRIVYHEEDDTEEFVSPEDEDMDALTELAEQLLMEDCCCDDDCCCDEGCGCDHCGEDK